MPYSASGGYREVRGIRKCLVDEYGSAWWMSMEVRSCEFESAWLGTANCMVGEHGSVWLVSSKLRGEENGSA